MEVRNLLIVSAPLQNAQKESIGKEIRALFPEVQAIFFSTNDCARITVAHEAAKGPVLFWKTPSYTVTCCSSHLEKNLKIHGLKIAFKKHAEELKMKKIKAVKRKKVTRKIAA
jgi:hypothetical protein